MKNLIILDSEIRRDLKEFYESLEGGSEVVITTYETPLIRKVRNFKIVGSPFYHFLMWKKSYNYAKKLIEKDVKKIVCLNPLVGIFLGLFNDKGIDITLAGFLFEPKRNKIYYNLRKYLVNRTLKNVNRVVVYSNKEVEYYSNIFDNYKDKFKFVHYGLDYRNSSEYDGVLPEKFIFSGGGSNRDYETLVKAMELSNTDNKLVIATQPWRVPYHNNKNIIVKSDVVIENFGNVMQKSQVLVLSLKDTELSAGHMVMLQAMKLRVPIIVNDIPAVRDYVDESMVTFYQSKNAEQLSNILKSFKVDIEKINKAESLYNSVYTSKSLIDRLVLE